MACGSAKVILLTLSASSIAFLMVIAPQIAASPTALGESGNGLYDLNKRGWQDVSSSWGKRGWQDLQGTGWGKRAWERLNGAWGKRLTQIPEPEEDVDEIRQRPEWATKIRGSWGLRPSDREAAMILANFRGPWSKKAWEKLGNSWGKRYENEAEIPMEN